ncbi:MAG TPA: oligosaccharide flippase family protein [Steroidobacteraceae bacterium]
MTTLAVRARDYLASRLGTGLAGGAIATFALRASHATIEFLNLLLLARLLGAAEFGTYAIAIASANVLGVPAAAGFDRLLIREVAALRACERWGALRGLLARATQVALAASTLLALALAAVAWWSIRDESLQSALCWAALLLPLVAFARLRQAAVQGLGRVPAGLLPETLVQPVTTMLLVLLAFVGMDVTRSGANAVALQCAAAVAAMLVGIGLVRALWPRDARRTEPVFETARWLTSATPLMIMLGMNMLLVNADTIMMGWLVDETLAGQYRVAAQISMLVGFPMTAINMAVAPTLARDYALGDMTSLRRNTLRASRWALLAALPIALVLFVGGRTLLGLFGPEFAAVYPTLMVLAAGWLANSFAGATGYLLIMTKHEWLAAVIFTVAALATVGANYLLIRDLGAIGAALGTAGGMALLGLGFWTCARRLFFQRAIEEVE